MNKSKDKLNKFLVFLLLSKYLDCKRNYIEQEVIFYLINQNVNDLHKDMFKLKTKDCTTEDSGRVYNCNIYEHSRCYYSDSKENTNRLQTRDCLYLYVIKFSLRIKKSNISFRLEMNKSKNVLDIANCRFTISDGICHYDFEFPTLFVFSHNVYRIAGKNSETLCLVKLDGDDYSYPSLSTSYNEDSFFEELTGKFNEKKERKIEQNNFNVFLPLNDVDVPFEFISVSESEEDYSHESVSNMIPKYEGVSMMNDGTNKTHQSTNSEKDVKTTIRDDICIQSTSFGSRRDRKILGYNQTLSTNVDALEFTPLSNIQEDIELDTINGEYFHYLLNKVTRETVHEAPNACSEKSKREEESKEEELPIILVDDLSINELGELPREENNDILKSGHDTDDKSATYKRSLEPCENVPDKRNNSSTDTNEVYEIIESDIMSEGSNENNEFRTNGLLEQVRLKTFLRRTLLIIFLGLLGIFLLEFCVLVLLVVYKGLNI